MENLNLYLKNLDISNNPWREEGFDLCRFDTLEPGSEYTVRGVKVTFKDSAMRIEFFREDSVLGNAMAGWVLSKDWDFDGEILIRKNEKKIEVPVGRYRRKNKIRVFELLLESTLADAGELCELTLEFSKAQSYRSERCNIFFVVDRDHEDSYYLELTLENRK